MPVAQRIKPYMWLPLLASGGWLAWLLDPLDWQDGLLLFVFGMVAGDWLRELNPRKRVSPGPEIAWNDMYASERLSYFLVPIALGVAGLLALATAIHKFSRLNDWRSIGLALVICGFAILTAYLGWKNRHAE